MAKQNDVAFLIRGLRAERGESLRSAAKHLGVDASHLARLESGEKQMSSSLGDRVSDYYNIDSDDIHLAAGRLPEDVVSILLSHPDEIQRLRARYRNAD